MFLLSSPATSTGCLVAALTTASMTAITQGGIKPTAAIRLYLRHACTATHEWRQKRKHRLFSSSLIVVNTQAHFFLISRLISPDFCLLVPHRFRKLLEEAPLMTKSLREAQMKEKMDRYPKVSASHKHIITIGLGFFSTGCF